MKRNVYIVFRRRYEQDDIDYGSFEPIYVSMNQNWALAIFLNLYNSALRDNDAVNCRKNKDHVEYDKKGWHYELKIEEFQLDSYNVPIDD